MIDIYDLQLQSIFYSIALQKFKIFDYIVYTAFLNKMYAYIFMIMAQSIFLGSNGFRSAVKFLKTIDSNWKSNGIIVMD